MKIVLLGYGKMGRAVEEAALKKGHVIVEKIDEHNAASMTQDLLRHGDVAIEFSAPQVAAGHLLACLEAGIPVVSGTTGWRERFDEVTSAFNRRNGALLYASNFSIGVNILFDLNRRLAALMDGQPEYNMEIWEAHHIHKLDKPSGTALTLADDMLKAIRRKAKWCLEGDHSGRADAIVIRSVREGEIAGIHEVRYDSAADSISLRHEAFSRSGFAAGAVLAAEWLPGRHGVFGMADVLRSLTQV